MGPGGIVAGAAREWALWRPGPPACTARWTPDHVLAGAPGDPGVPACCPLYSSLVGGPNAVGHHSHDRDFSVVVLAGPQQVGRCLTTPWQRGRPGALGRVAGVL